MSYYMFLQHSGAGSFISALCTLVDFTADRCYKIKISFNYVIVYYLCTCEYVLLQLIHLLVIRLPAILGLLNRLVPPVSEL
nr:unnamed protein product [Callosobruchus analis]